MGQLDLFLENKVAGHGIDEGYGRRVQFGVGCRGGIVAACRKTNDQGRLAKQPPTVPREIAAQRDPERMSAAYQRTSRSLPRSSSRQP